MEAFWCISRGQIPPNLEDDDIDLHNIHSSIKLHHCELAFAAGKKYCLIFAAILEFHISSNVTFMRTCLSPLSVQHVFWTKQKCWGSKLMLNFISMSRDCPTERKPYQIAACSIGYAQTLPFNISYFEDIEIHHFRHSFSSVGQHFINGW